MIWGKLTEESFIVHYQHPISAEGRSSGFTRIRLLLSAVTEYYTPMIGAIFFSRPCSMMSGDSGYQATANISLTPKATTYLRLISTEIRFWAGSKSTKELKLVAWSGAPTKQSCFFMDRDQAACRVRKKER
ncbi:hypothetical protein [Paenibacillus sp. FSL L8-0158]|uniref:hypothetical protein n=1 Tax=Paenibacillus sp. FSL L8-0158 TaxID=2954752 RepID=UPI003159223A